MRKIAKKIRIRIRTFISHLRPNFSPLRIRSESDAKTVRKICERGAKKMRKAVRKKCERGAKNYSERTVRKLCENRAKTLRKLCENHAKKVRKPCEIGAEAQRNRSEK